MAHVSTSLYRVFHGFGQAKYGSSVLGSSQFSILPLLPPKIMLDSKGTKSTQKQSSRFVNLNK